MTSKAESWECVPVSAIRIDIMTSCWVSVLLSTTSMGLDCILGMSISSCGWAAVSTAFKDIVTVYKSGREWTGIVVSLEGCIVIFIITSSKPNHIVSSLSHIGCASSSDFGNSGKLVSSKFGNVYSGISGIGCDIKFLWSADKEVVSVPSSQNVHLSERKVVLSLELHRNQHYLNLLHEIVTYLYWKDVIGSTCCCPLYLIYSWLMGNT